MSNSLQRLADLGRQWPWIFPRGIEPSARAWVEASQKRRGWYDGLRSDWYREAHPEGVLSSPPPPGLPPRAVDPFRDVATRRYPPAFVCHLSGAVLFSNEGMILTPDNRVLAEYYHEFNTRSLPQMFRSRPFQLLRCETTRIPEAVGLLAAPQGWNHYHWLFDVLPRLQLLEPWRGAIEKFAVPDPLTEVQRESLRLAGVDNDRLLPLSPGKRLRCQHLYAPSLPGSEGCAPPWALDAVRNRYVPLAADVAGAGPRIYIPRPPGGPRPILNEAELLDRLDRRGFRPVALDRCSFLDQVAIFRDAQVVVGAHGAGLANLIFAGRPAVLELFSADYLRPDCYFTLCRQRGFAYDCWIDPEVASASRPWGAIRADLEEVERKLDRLLS